jgi:hypothetical protein
MINGLAKLAAVSRPVITTEIGWDNATFTQGQTAQYVVDAALDGIKDGDAKLYYYSLFDDGSGQFGLMNQDGTPKPAGRALHDLTTLLADTGANAATFTPGSLSFTLTGNQTTDNTLLVQKSNGSDWLALWNENAAAHTVTLQLAAAASQILVFDLGQPRERPPVDRGHTRGRREHVRWWDGQHRRVHGHRRLQQQPEPGGDSSNQSNCRRQRNGRRQRRVHHGCLGF